MTCVVSSARLRTADVLRFRVAWYNEDNYLMKSCDTPYNSILVLEIGMFKPVTDGVSEEILSRASRNGVGPLSG